jgi:hypothetical protein
VREQEPILGTDDSEGHVFVWTCPALDSDEGRHEVPEAHAEAAAEHVDEPLPSDRSVVPQPRRRHDAAVGKDIK